MRPCTPRHELVWDVVCCGAGECVRVGALAVVEWERDYWYDGLFGLSADFADTGELEADGIDSRLVVGAAAFISFGGQNAATFLDAEPRDATSDQGARAA